MFDVVHLFEYNILIDIVLNVHVLIGLRAIIFHIIFNFQFQQLSILS